MNIRSVVMLCPEPPYPLHGGGAWRTASLLNYFARFADVDLILFSESGAPAEIPPGLVRSQQVIRLRRHSRHPLARWWRNAGRALRGVPPLVDRLTGYEAEVSAALAGRHYDLAIAEHSWCAAYSRLLRQSAARTFLDLHNIESELHDRAAAVSPPLIGAGHRRFAQAMSRIEARVAPQFTYAAVTSERDAALLRRLAPDARVMVYPNALQPRSVPAVTAEPDLIAFSGNFEYHPNIDAVCFLCREIWPAILQRRPGLRLRLIGRGEQCVRSLIAPNPSIEATGPVEDALTEIARAAVVLAPLRVGSGTRLKILEAWQVRRPVVATRLAAEGLDARPDQNLMFAESPGEFADAIVHLLDHPAHATQLGEAGHASFSARYSWPAAWAQLDALFA